VPQRKQAQDVLRGDARGIFPESSSWAQHLSPQNSASLSSATSVMTWLLRSIDHSLSAKEARNA
jgi:hypothetical protein